MVLNLLLGPVSWCVVKETGSLARKLNEEA